MKFSDVEECRDAEKIDDWEPEEDEQLDSVSVTGGSDNESIDSSVTASREKLRRQTPTEELRKQFIRHHRRRSLSNSVLNRVARKDTAYTDDLVKKKQYLTITKQHEVRDAKFDAECNILLSTQSSVQLYDANGVFREKLYLNRVTEPWGIHIDKRTGNVFVSDYAEDCVKEFNTLGIIVQEYGKVASPCGITVSDTGYLFVCSPSEGCVHVYNQKGELAMIIGNKILTSPTSVATHQNSILISDQLKITGFNIFGDVDFIYKQETDAERPSCLCVDRRFGFVLVTNYSKNRIIAFTQEMKRAIKVKDTRSPTICTVSDYGQLLIGERIGNGTALKMFRLK